MDSQSRASASSGPDKLDKLRTCMKHMMEKIGNTVDLSPEMQELLAEDPRDKLKEEQKAMNAKRKMINKIERIKQQIEDRESRFQFWKKNVKETLKKEEARHLDHMDKLKKELATACAERDGTITVDDDSDSGLEDAPPGNADPSLGEFMRAMQQSMEQSMARANHLEQQNQQMMNEMARMQQLMMTASAVPPMETSETPAAVTSPQHPATPAVRRIGDQVDPMAPFRNPRGRERSSPYGEGGPPGLDSTPGADATALNGLG